MITTIFSILETRSTKPKHPNSTTWTQPISEVTDITKLNNDSQNQENKAQNMKYVVRERKTIPFSWRFEIEMKQKWRFLRVTRWVWERVEMGKTMNNHKSSREKLKMFKTDLFAQNTRFSRLNQVTCKLLGPIARTLKTKILKKISKCFSRLEVLLMRESWGMLRKSLSTLTIGTSTSKQVARLSHKKH